MLRLIIVMYNDSIVLNEKQRYVITGCYLTVAIGRIEIAYEKVKSFLYPILVSIGLLGTI